MELPIDRVIAEVEGDKMPGADNPRVAPPWWVWVVIMIGLAELGWFGTSYLRSTQQSASTATEIQDIQEHQSNLASSINTLDIDVQALTVNVAVLTQKMADQGKRK